MNTKRVHSEKTGAMSSGSLVGAEGLRTTRLVAQNFCPSFLRPTRFLMPMTDLNRESENCHSKTEAHYRRDEKKDGRVASSLHEG